MLLQMVSSIFEMVSSTFRMISLNNYAINNETKGNKTQTNRISNPKVTKISINMSKQFIELNASNDRKKIQPFKMSICGK